MRSGKGKTRDELIADLAILRQRVAQLETECTEQGRILNALMDSSPDLVIFKDRQSVYRSCKRAFWISEASRVRISWGRTTMSFIPSRKRSGTGMTMPS